MTMKMLAAEGLAAVFTAAPIRLSTSWVAADGEDRGPGPSLHRVPPRAGCRQARLPSLTRSSRARVRRETSRPPSPSATPTPTPTADAGAHPGAGLLAHGHRRPDHRASRHQSPPRRLIRRRRPCPHDQYAHANSPTETLTKPVNRTLTNPGDHRPSLLELRSGRRLSASGSGCPRSVSRGAGGRTAPRVGIRTYVAWSRFKVRRACQQITNWERPRPARGAGRA